MMSPVDAPYSAEKPSKISIGNNTITPEQLTEVSNYTPVIVRENLVTNIAPKSAPSNNNIPQIEIKPVNQQ